MVWSSRCPFAGTLVTFGSHLGSYPHPWTCVVTHVLTISGPRHVLTILLQSASICVTATITVNEWQTMGHPFPVCSFFQETRPLFLLSMSTFEKRKQIWLWQRCQQNNKSTAHGCWLQVTVFNENPNPKPKDLHWFLPPLCFMQQFYLYWANHINKHGLIIVSF